MMNAMKAILLYIDMTSKVLLQYTDRMCLYMTIDNWYVLLQICKCLLPNLLMLIGDNRVAAQSIPRPVLMVRDQAASFIMLVSNFYVILVSIYRGLFILI